MSLVDKFCVAEIDIYSKGFLKTLSWVINRNLSSNLSHSIHNKRKIDFNLPNFNTKLLSRSCTMSNISALQKSLRGYASSIQAVTAEEISFNKCDLRSLTYSTSRCHKTSCTTAYNYKVIFLLKKWDRWWVTYIELGIVPLDGSHLVVKVATMLVKHHRRKLVHGVAKLLGEVRHILDDFVQVFSFELAVFRMRVADIVPRVTVDRLES